MANIFFEFSAADVQQRLAEVGQRVADLTPAMQEIGEALLLSTRQRFDAQSDPEGRKWTPLTPRYAKAKGKRKNALRGILTLTGALRDTIAYQAGPRAVQVGSNRAYAAIHQLGGKTGRGGTMPARPFLGLSAGDREEIVAILADFVEG